MAASLSWRLRQCRASRGCGDRQEPTDEAGAFVARSAASRTCTRSHTLCVAPIVRAIQELACTQTGARHVAGGGTQAVNRYRFTRTRRVLSFVLRPSQPRELGGRAAPALSVTASAPVFLAALVVFTLTNYGGFARQTTKSHSRRVRAWLKTERSTSFQRAVGAASVRRRASNGKQYSVFGLGQAIACVPFVWAARAANHAAPRRLPRNAYPHASPAAGRTAVARKPNVERLPTLPGSIPSFQPPPSSSFTIVLCCSARVLRPRG